MAVRVGINGFGRIGRLVYRAIRAHHAGRLHVLAVNDVGDPAVMTQLLKYDTNHGRFPGDVSRTADGFLADGEHVRVLAERDPARLPWKALDVVVESTGLFRDAGNRAWHGRRARRGDG